MLAGRRNAAASAAPSPPQLPRNPRGLGVRFLPAGFSGNAKRPCRRCARRPGALFSVQKFGAQHRCLRHCRSNAAAVAAMIGYEMLGYVDSQQHVQAERVERPSLVPSPRRGRCRTCSRQRRRWSRQWISAALRETSSVKRTVLGLVWFPYAGHHTSARDRQQCTFLAAQALRLTRSPFHPGTSRQWPVRRQPHTPEDAGRALFH